MDKPTCKRCGTELLPIQTAVWMEGKLEPLYRGEHSFSELATGRWHSQLRCDQLRSDCQP